MTGICLPACLLKKDSKWWHIKSQLLSEVFGYIGHGDILPQNKVEINVIMTCFPFYFHVDDLILAFFPLGIYCNFTIVGFCNSHWRLWYYPYSKYFKCYIHILLVFVNCLSLFTFPYLKCNLKAKFGFNGTPVYNINF